MAWGKCLEDSIGYEKSKRYRIIMCCCGIVQVRRTKRKALFPIKPQVKNLLFRLWLKQQMAGTLRILNLSLSRATVFREYAKIKQVTGANYNKKDGTWTF